MTSRGYLISILRSSSQVILSVRFSSPRTKLKHLAPYVRFRLAKRPDDKISRLEDGIASLDMNLLWSRSRVLLIIFGWFMVAAKLGNKVSPPSLASLGSLATDCVASGAQLESGIGTGLSILHI